MAWIESHTALARHPKTLRLARRLSLSIPCTLGHLHLLWWWAIEYAPDGELSEFAPEEVAMACMWDGDPAVLMDALRGAGFVDQDGALHDWRDYAGKLLERRAADAEKQRRWRDQHKPVTSPPLYSAPNDDITVTLPLRRRATVPNPTVPNQPTQPTRPDGRRARAREASPEPSTALALSTAVPKPRPRDPIWDALAEIYGDPLLEGERKNRNGVCQQFRSAARAQSMTGESMAELIITAHGNWPNVMADATETPNALAKHFTSLLAGPQRNGRYAGTVVQHKQTVTEYAAVNRGPKRGVGALDDDWRLSDHASK